MFENLIVIIKQISYISFLSVIYKTTTDKYPVLSFIALLYHFWSDYLKQFGIASRMRESRSKFCYGKLIIVKVIVCSHVEAHISENNQILHESKGCVHTRLTVSVVTVVEIESNHETKHVSNHQLFLWEGSIITITYLNNNECRITIIRKKLNKELKQMKIEKNYHLLW